MDLKSLNLSNEDFDLMIKGLDSIAAAKRTMDLMGEFLISDKGVNPEERRKAMEHRMNKREKEMAIEMEDVRILQGKLLMLKRHMQQEGALADTYSIINNEGVKF